MNATEVRIAIVRNEAEKIHVALDIPLHTCQNYCAAYRNFSISALNALKDGKITDDILARESVKIMGNLVALVMQRTQTHGQEVKEYQSI